MKQKIEASEIVDSILSVLALFDEPMSNYAIAKEINKSGEKFQTQLICHHLDSLCDKGFVEKSNGESSTGRKNVRKYSVKFGHSPNARAVSWTKVGNLVFRELREYYLA